MPQNDQREGAATDFKLVVVAASAGGLAALTRILRDLPREFPVPIAVVQHVDPHHHSLVPEILARHTHLRVREAHTGDIPVRGVVYMAPPDQHLEIASTGMIELTKSEHIHFVRPSADRLFMSAAHAFGPVVAVVLTGTGTDGTDGALAVKAAGGILIAQDEATSAFFGMPGAAIQTGVVDYVLPVEAIASRLMELVGSPSA